MFWDHVFSAFADELEKISEVNIIGLSAGKVLSVPQPQPVEVEGFRKAREILERAEQTKVSSVALAPGSNRLMAKNKDDPRAVQQAKGLGAYTIGGAAAGRMIGEFSAGRVPSVAAKNALHTNRWYGTAIGAGLGAAEFGRRRLAQHKAQSQAKVAAAFSPGLSLKWGKQVGKVRPQAFRDKGSIASVVKGSQIH
jgi:hypothetical protein